MPREELLAALQKMFSYDIRKNLKLSPAGAARESHLPSSASSITTASSAPSTASAANDSAGNDCVLPSKPAAQLPQAPFAHAVMWCAVRAKSPTIFQKSCFQFMFDQFRVVDTMLLYFLFLNLGCPIILYVFLND